MDPVALAVVVGVIAAIYASVGQAGGSGYLAVLTLAGLPVAETKPAALLLNVVVATVGTWRFAAAGHLNLSRVWPILAAGVPAAFAGGTWLPEAHIYAPLVGSVLLFAGVALALRAWRGAVEPVAEVRPVGLPAALLVGATLGALAGITGTGGGVFLAPVMLLLGWSSTKGTAATCALFVLLNSASALLGFGLGGDDVRPLPDVLPWLGVSVALGGGIGATVGATRLSPRALQTLLAAVILLASGKMLSTLLA